jgi:uncharacterized membrane protein (UPF0136 family)
MGADVLRRNTFVVKQTFVLRIFSAKKPRLSPSRKPLPAILTNNNDKTKN